MDQLTLKGQKRQDAEALYKPDRDGFVEVVFKVDKGRAQALPVKTGIQSDEKIEILEGAEEGSEVVSGSYRALSRDLENGAAVTVNNTRKPAREPEKAGGREE
jgi:HlyD family secretion protein